MFLVYLFFLSDDKWKNLVVENNGRCNQQVMIELKLKSQERKINDLFEIHSYLMNINSSENSKNTDDKTPSTVSIRHFLITIIECELSIICSYL